MNIAGKTIEAQTAVMAFLVIVGFGLASQIISKEQNAKVSPPEGPSSRTVVSSNNGCEVTYFPGSTSKEVGHIISVRCHGPER